MRTTARYHLPFIAGLIAAAGACLPPAPADSPAPRLAQTGAWCTATETGREQLRVEGGRFVHVEPVAMSSNSRGDVLLAGLYNYAYGPDASGVWGRVLEDSIFGVVIPAARHPVLVRSPVPTRLLGGVAAAPRPRGGWDVVFSRITDRSGEFRSDSVLELWHGVVDETGWSELERLPMPVEGVLIRHAGSELVRYGDTLAIALRLRSPDGEYNVALYQRGPKGWTHDVVRLRTAAYTALGHTDAMGLLMAVVQPDTTLRRSGNALFVLAREGTAWRRLRKVVSGTTDRAYNPSLQPWRGELVLSWHETDGDDSLPPFQHANRLRGGLPSGGSILVLDSAAMRGSLRGPLEAGEGGPVWLVAHGRRGQGQSLRFVQDRGDQAVEIGRLAYPFLTPFAATSPRPGELLVAGGMVTGSPSFVATLLLRFRVECREP